MVTFYAFGIFLLIVLLLIIKRTSGKVRMVLKKSARILYLIFFAEIIGLFGLRIITRDWLFEERSNYNARLFEEHPYLVADNRATVDHMIHGIRYTHDSLGHRLTPIKKTTKKILTIGGSTTYGTSVNNENTWPYLLDNELGSEFDIINMAVPGHSTVQHVVMSSLLNKIWNPEMIIYHVGLNDLRNSHVDSVAFDYSNFHSPTMFGAMGLCYREKWPKLALVRISILLLQELDLYPVCLFHRAKFSGKINSEIDKRVAEIYERNLGILMNMNHLNGTKALFIPQILPEGNIRNNNYKWWIPYIADSVVAKHVVYFNEITRKVALSNNEDYLSEVDSFDWNVKLFADPSHLNDSGNEILAKMVAARINLLLNTPDSSITP